MCHAIKPARRYRPHRVRRSGLTLVELLVSVSIVTIVIGGMGAMAVTIGNASRHNRDQQLLLQHARVAMQRIENSIAQAHASEQFPGLMVFNSYAGSTRLPETLVIWAPQNLPADPAGLPRFSELIIYAPGIYTPDKLVEIRAENDHRIVPPVTNLSQWQTELDALRSASQPLVLTNRLRTANLPGFGNFGVVRFNHQMRPDATSWQQYKDGSVNWDSLAWPLDNAGNSYGVRQVWCSIEMQLTTEAGGADPTARSTTAFFGSGAVNYGLTP